MQISWPQCGHVSWDCESLLVYWICYLPPYLLTSFFGTLLNCLLAGPLTYLHALEFTSMLDYLLTHFLAHLLTCLLFKRRQVASIRLNVCRSVCVWKFFGTSKESKNQKNQIGLFDFSVEGNPFSILKLLNQINQKVIK